MTSRATRHAAALAAAGLWICTFGLGPATAQEQAAAVGSATGVTAAPDKPIALHARKAASRSHKVRHHTAKAKPAEPAKVDTAKAEDNKADTPTSDQPDNAISPNVANANAQWPAETPPANTYNVSDKAGTVLSKMGAQAEQPATAAPDNAADHPDVAASDQLNDLDRAASADDGKPPLTLARASIDTPEAAPAPVEAASNDSNSPWTQTSMIGKVFIALGGVLTLASAARMFMA